MTLTLDASPTIGNQPREVSGAVHWAAQAEELAGVGYWQLDVPTSRIHWSEGLFRLYGLPVGNEPDLEVALSVIHPEDSVAANDLLQKAIREGCNYSNQVRLRRTDGSWRTVTNRATCIRDSAGNVANILGTVLDITDAMQAIDALKKSEALHRLLAEHATDMIIRADRQGTILYVSPACRAFGYEPNELIGKSGAELVHPEDVVSFAGNVIDLMSGASVDRSRMREHRFKCKNGDWVWLQGNPTVVRDANGAPIEIVNVFRDVTERRAIDASLAVAKEQAETAAAVKTEFLANMSHELRTPLTSIIGFAQLLKEQPELSHQSSKFAQRVVDASQALLAIVNDVLDFSKLEAGQVEIKREPVSPSATADEAIQLFAPQADAKGITLHLDLGHRLPDRVSLDGPRVRQILHNLVGNAVKFTDEGSVTLSVRYAEGLLNFEVRDTGPGIPAEKLDRLFKRFSQVDGSSSRTHGGTGLGLAICKGLADAMDGNLSVSSQFGQGATFALELPVSDLSGEVIDPRGEPDSISFESLRILAVDDNAANQILIRTLLESRDAMVVIAASGQEALDWAARARFDIVLMDLHMPGMNGVQAATAIRTSAGPNAETPILAFTADAIQLDAPEFVDGQFAGCVLKPVKTEELFKAIDAACTLRNSLSTTQRVRYG